MGLSTHVLDTMHGCPAAAMPAELRRVVGGHSSLVRRFTLNQNGKSDTPLYADGELEIGNYCLVFEVAQYFRSRGVALPDPPFLDRVQIDFGIADTKQHYHVPLLVSPWSYSTYRGS